MTTAFDDATLDAFADAGFQLLGLPIDPPWRAGIRGNLKASLTLAAAVTGFALPDETDPAPVFVA